MRLAFAYWRAERAMRKRLEREAAGDEAIIAADRYEREKRGLQRMVLVGSRFFGTVD